MRRLKVLLATLIIVLVFLLGYSSQAGDVEEIMLDKSQSQTGDAVEETVIYTREMTVNNLVEKVNNLVGDYNISYAIVNECVTQVPDDYKQCIKNVIGVANAESTLFTKGMYPSNNGFWLMYKGTKRKFSSVEESINVRVALYVKNGWGTRTTGQAWLKWKYCASACTHWVKNYNSAVNKLELD